MKKSISIVLIITMLMSTLTGMSCFANTKYESNSLTQTHDTVKNIYGDEKKQRDEKSKKFKTILAWVTAVATAVSATAICAAKMLFKETKDNFANIIEGNGANTNDDLKGICDNPVFIDINSTKEYYTYKGNTNNDANTNYELNGTSDNPMFTGKSIIEESANGANTNDDLNGICNNPMFTGKSIIEESANDANTNDDLKGTFDDPMFIDRNSTKEYYNYKGNTNNGANTNDDLNGICDNPVFTGKITMEESANGANTNDDLKGTFDNPMFIDRNSTKGYYDFNVNDGYNFCSSNKNINKIIESEDDTQLEPKKSWLGWLYGGICGFISLYVLTTGTCIYKAGKENIAKCSLTAGLFYPFFHRSIMKNLPDYLARNKAGIMEMIKGFSEDNFKDLIKNIQKAKIYKKDGKICVFYNGIEIPTSMKSLF